MTVNIDELELDIIKEIINIGLAKSADSFALIAKDMVLISVPEVNVIDAEDIVDTLVSNDRTDTVIQSDIKDDLNGKTFIVFSEQQAERLAFICIGKKEDFSGNYPAMKRSLLLEISNILTAAIVTQLANILRLSIYGTPPVIVPFALRRTFKDLISDFQVFRPFVLTIKTQFINASKLVEMPLLIVFDIDTVEKVVSMIRQLNKTNPGWMAKRTAVA